MLSELIGNTPNEVQESVDALWSRLGVDHENLSDSFGEFAIEGQRAMRLDAAGLRAGVDGTQNIELAQRNGTHNGTDNDTKERKVREFSQAMVTATSLDRMIADINWQIGEIDARIEQIDARIEAIALEREALERRILEDRPELERLRQEQEDIVDEALIDCDAAELAHQRAMEAVIRATSPDAIAAAEQTVILTREEAETARAVYLQERATLEGYEQGLAEIDAAIERLGVLSAEELALMQERGDLVMDREQLIVLRERLEDPAIRAAVERGEMTNQDVLDMMPEELQPSIMESLTTRFQQGWEYGLNIVSNAYDSAINGVSYAANVVTNTITSVFTRATQDTAETDATPEEALEVTAKPIPVLQLTNG